MGSRAPPAPVTLSAGCITRCRGSAFRHAAAGPNVCFLAMLNCRPDVYRCG